MMRTTSRVIPIAALVALAGLPYALHAQDQGFTTLFNGKDLTGWVYGQREDGTENRNGKGYQVEKGVLFTTKEDGGNLFTKKEYANFVLRFEFKLTENANNGIGIRAPLQGDAAYTGIEIQVLDDSGSQYAKLTSGAVPRLHLPHVSGQARTPEASG